MSGCCDWPWEQQCVTPQNCINVPNNCTNSNTCGSILAVFPGVRTCAEAMSKVGEGIAKRTGGKVLVTVGSTTQYGFEIKLGRSTSRLSVTTASQCSFPIQATLVTQCSHTSSAQLGSLDQLLSWVIEGLK